MSLITALDVGVSGMDSNSTDLSVIGDNIANANTVGFKASRAVFEDMLNQQLIGGVGGQGEGMGSRVLAIQKLMTQGSLSTTGQATDMALEGDGMFVVKGTHNGMSGQFYTRAGQFTADKDGFLVNQEGLRVQGFQATNGVIGGTQGDLQVAGLVVPGVASTTATLKGNLEPSALVGDTSKPTTVQIYDSLGKEHDVTVTWTKKADNDWTWTATADGGDIAGGTKGTPVQIANGEQTYDANGQILTSTQTSTFNPGGGATAPQALTFDMSGFLQSDDGLKESTTTFTQADGSASGTLQSISVDKNGFVTGTFNNGDTKTIGQVEVAKFQAPDKLDRIGGNLFAETTDSGQATIGAPSSGGRGDVIGGALEQSNVDLANEFVKMIAAQRDFEANSKTITTADQLLTELIQIKR